MTPFFLAEIILYIAPIIFVVVVRKYFKHLLTDQQYISLTEADAALPITLVSVHFLSLFIFGRSLVPVLILIALIKAFFNFYKESKQGKDFSIVRVVRPSLTFFEALNSLTYFALVIGRLIQVIIY